MLKYWIGTILLSFAIQSTVITAESFMIEAIEIDGLQRIESETVFNYLPVSVGDVLEVHETKEILQSLYDTKFFDDIQLVKVDNKLHIRVLERPTIGQITLSGNRAIPSDRLLDVLKIAGLSEGEVYEEAILAAMEKSLLAEYTSRGQYNAEVKTNVVSLDRNRVSIAINIYEGKVAKIRQIRILGNEKFSDQELLRTFQSKTRGIWATIAGKNRYASERLESDLESLRSYYLDRGYLNFTVTNTQVSITPDKQDVYIIITVTEGEPYTVSTINLSGDYIVAEQELLPLLEVQSGDTFSRRALINSGEAITDYLGDRGYFYTNVQPIPQIDQENHEVALTLLVQPGNLVYVRRIYFSGNQKTSEVALRHSLLQQEGSLYSTSDVRESTRQLNTSNYLRNAQVTTHPVVDSDDQIDLEYAVDEDQAAMAIFQVGYSTTDKLIFNVGFTQLNFLGSGREFGINLQTGAFSDNVHIRYVNPDYTIDGISRGIELYLGKTRPGRIDRANYTTDEYGASIFYSIPRSNYSRVNLGYGYDNIRLNLTGSASDEVKGFTNKFGNHFGSLRLTGGWSRSTYDRSIMTTRGTQQSLGVEIGVPATNDPLRYYKATYTITNYLPLYREDFIFATRGSVGYGDGYGANDNLPFFKNYYAGGIGSVRGYRGNSLGPRDSKGDALGGDTLLTGSLAFIVPNYFSPNNLRTSVFLDVGNVFDTQDGLSLGELRYSLGAAATWFSPIGPLEFSLASPINKRAGDRDEIFQFTIGYSL